MYRFSLSVLFLFLAAAPALAQPGSGVPFTLENGSDKVARVTLIGPDGDEFYAKDYLAQPGERLELRMVVGGSAKIDFGFGSGLDSMDIPVKSGSSHRLYWCSCGSMKLSNEYQTDEFRQPGFADALDIKVEDLGNGEYLVVRAHAFGEGRGLGLRSGDKIVSMAAVGALDDFGQPMDGMFLSSLTVEKRWSGDQIEYNLQQRGLSIWFDN